MTVPVRLADQIVKALALPEATKLDQKVAKKLLLDSCEFVAADKRLLNEALQEFVWVAALKPSTCGLRAVNDSQRTIEEVQVLRLRLKAGRHPPRLLALCHRVVPYPVLLIVESGEVTRVSVAHKRNAEGTAGGLVLEGAPLTIDVPAKATWLPTWLASLALAQAAGDDLAALYDAWWRSLVAAVRAQALERFDVPRTAAAAHQVLSDLDELADIQREQKKLLQALKRETQMASRVELNLAIRQATTDYDDVRRRLLETGP